MFKKIISSVVATAFGLTVGLGAPLLAQAADDIVPPGAEAASSDVVRDDQQLRVYYSESLGAGEKVYHLSACTKVPAYQPIVCNPTNEMDYSAQCSPGGKSNYGKMVKGCDAGPNDPALESIDPNNPAAPKDVKPKDYKSCEKEPTRHLFAFAKRYSVLEVKENATEAEKEDPKNSIGTIAWEQEREPDRAEILKILYPNERERDAKNLAIQKDGTQIIAKQMYQIASCAQADVLFKPDGTALPPKDTMKDAVEKIEKYQGDLQPLIDAGCNNDNTAGPIKRLSIGEDGIPIRNDIRRSTSLNNVAALSCTAFERLTGYSGTDLLARYIGAIYRWAASIGGIIAVLVIVLSGLQMIVGSVDPGSIEKSKERITQSLLGLVLLFLSALILYTINPTFFTP